ARKIAESQNSRLYYVDGIFSSNTPSSKPLSPATSTTSDITDDSYLEDRATVTDTTPDMINERDDTNLVESQSFASSSPKETVNSSPEDEDAEGEVILFTGRHLSVAESDNNSNGQVSEKSSNRSPTVSTNPTTAEVLLNQVLASNQKSPKGNQNDLSIYWNHFNTPQLFPNNNENNETSASQKLEFLYASTRPLTNNTNSISNSISNDSFASSPPFSLSTPVSGVPNASLDPLVPPTKRTSSEIKPTSPVTSTSSASLFAFPGSDGGVSKFGLFGNSGTNIQNFSNIPSYLQNKPNVMPATTINPPPGFSTESANLDMHRGSPNQSRFQTSNAF
ncbi:2505_t:CDS:2, partial [Acaulospora morrowiae]